MLETIIAATGKSLIEYGLLGIMCMALGYGVFKLALELMLEFRASRTRDDAKNAQIIAIKDAAENRAWAASDRYSELAEKIHGVMEVVRSDLAQMRTDINRRDGEGG